VSNELKVEGKLDLGKASTTALAKSASDPGSASEGDVYYNTTSLAIRIFQNGVWRNLVSSTGSPGLPVTEVFTLSNTDISNKFVTLSAAPATPANTKLDVVGGPTQAYGPDFTISSSQLSWSSLFLDGVLVAGDRLIVQHD